MILLQSAKSRLAGVCTAMILGMASAGAVAQAAPSAAKPAPAPAAAKAPLRVMASFSILGDMVRQVGGDQVSVSVLVGPNGDAHSYEPTSGDAKRLGQARLLFVNGLDFETWLPRLAQAASFHGKEIVASDGVKARRFEGGPSRDPHAWQDLANGEIYVHNIIEGLAAADPAHAAQYRQRGAAYGARIDALNKQAHAAFDAIAAGRRKLVTSHDAFSYFGQAYGVTIIPALAITTDAEPSAAQMARLIDQVRKENVPAVFLENVSSPRLVEQIAHETSAKVGGTLYSDALSQPGTPGSTYLGMMASNIREISDALKP